MNKSVNEIAYHSTSISIFTSSFASLETCTHDPPKEEELVKDYDSEGKLEPFELNTLSYYKEEETLLFAQANAEYFNKRNDTTTDVTLAPDSECKMKVSKLKKN